MRDGKCTTDQAHEVVPKCESFEVRFPDGGPSRFFYWDDLPSRPAQAGHGHQRSGAAAFFDGDNYKGSRLSVIMDECETQAFDPLLTAAPTTPAPNAKPAKHKAARSSTQ